MRSGIDISIKPDFVVCFAHSQLENFGVNLAGNASDK